MQHVVRVESAGNPFAISVVGGHLVRQPKNINEAIATAKMLEHKGFNFSVGIAQVNRYNLSKYGLSSYEKAFQVCPNLQAGSQILKECYNRGKDWGKAFSCYYSGNFVTGYRHGYVQKVFASMQQSKPVSLFTQGNAINVVGKADRKVVKITTHPAYQNPQVQSPQVGAYQANPIVQQAQQYAYSQPNNTAAMTTYNQPPAQVQLNGHVVSPYRIGNNNTQMVTGTAPPETAPATPQSSSNTDSAFVF